MTKNLGQTIMSAYNNAVELSGNKNLKVEFKYEGVTYKTYPIGLGGKVTEQAKRIQQLEERLEITHQFRGPDNKKVEIPPAERDNFPDAIDARDVTIQILEERIRALTHKE